MTIRKVNRGNAIIIMGMVGIGVGRVVLTMMMWLVGVMIGVEIPLIIRIGVHMLVCLGCPC